MVEMCKRSLAQKIAEFCHGGVCGYLLFNGHGWVALAASLSFCYGTLNEHYAWERGLRSDSHDT